MKTASSLKLLLAFATAFGTVACGSAPPLVAHVPCQRTAAASVVVTSSPATRLGAATGASARTAAPGRRSLGSRRQGSRLIQLVLAAAADSRDPALRESTAIALSEAARLRRRHAWSRSHGARPDAMAADARRPPTPEKATPVLSGAAKDAATRGRAPRAEPPPARAALEERAGHRG